jgi:glycosyltransferase 2 family protein
MSPTPRKRTPWLSLILNLFGWVGGLFLLWLIYQQFSSVSTQAAQRTLDLPLLAACALLGVAGHALLSFLPRISLSYVYPQHGMSMGTTYRVWFISQAAKYIPGGVWQVAARGVAYVRLGMPPILASAVCLWEVQSILLGSLVMSVVGAPWLSETFQGWPLALVLGGLGVAMLGVAAFSVALWPWQMLERAIGRWVGVGRVMVSLLTALGPQRTRLLIHMAAWAAFTWLIIGASFSLLMMALGLPPISYLEALVKWGAGWAFGFLVVIAPSGLGAREAALTALFATTYGPADTLLLVLAARLWWQLSEATNILLAALWGALSALPQLTTDQQQQQ